MIKFKFFCEKIFDGNFYRKSEQDESLEVIQKIGKTVDSRKVREDRLALRNGIYVLFKRPVTAVDTGYLIAKVVNDSGAETMSSKYVDAKIINNYGGNDFKVGSSIELSVVDVYAVSEDNNRFYIVYPPVHPIPSSQEKKVNGKRGDDEKSMMAKLRAMESVGESISEKYLSNSEVQDLIDRAADAVRAVLKDKSKSSEEKSRADEVLDWIADVDSTFQKDGKLHPNTVNGLSRIIAGVSSGRFGWAKSDYATTGDGSVPSNYAR